VGKFEKGSKIAREAGQKSKPGKHAKTKQWEELGEFITQSGAERAMRILNQLPDQDFLEQYNKLLNYFKPKITHNINEDTIETPKAIIFKVKK